MLARIGRLKRRMVGRVTAAQQRRSERARDGAPRPRRRDVEAFLSVARQSFIRLQAAWDDADMQALSVLTTDQLLDDLREQLASRGPGPNRTEVLRLDARLLALEEMRDAFVASVEFSGLIRERLEDHAAPFRELWLLAKPKLADHGWQLARVQALG